jgi:PAS domain S-box-containing protein
MRFEDHLASQPELAQAECYYWIRKLEARFLAGDHAAALDASSRAQRLLWSTPANLERAEYEFYSALALAASWHSVPSDRRQQHFDALSAHSRQLEIWAKHCPENFENRSALVRAEMARLEDRPLDAEQLYEKAIGSAHANGFPHNEAVASEVAARFYAARGLEKVAYTYLQDARYSYLRWGAAGKVRQLEELNPQLRENKRPAGVASTIGEPVDRLDLATVMKVSQAVTGEMVLEKLIDTLMRTAIEHAGAERGVLILPRGAEHRIEAEAVTSGDGVVVRRGEASVELLPDSIIHLVVRSQEWVILDDATVNNAFSSDDYIRQSHARSILCLPLINRGKLTAVLYLENNLAPGVFTPDRIAILKLLASQAAISLENSHLYRDLEQREAKIRRLVEANIVGIFIWDFEGRILEANDEFLRIVGCDRDDLKSGRMRWTDLTPPEWLERDTGQRLPELKATGSLQPFEKEYFRKDGGRVPVLIGVTSFEETGNQGVAFVLDLSEQKRSEESHRLVLETASDVVISLDESGLILLANPATKRVFGYDSEELIGKPLTTLMPEFMRKLHETGLRRYLATGQRHMNWQGAELVGLRKNGEEFPLEVSFGEQIRKGRRVFTGFLRDVSEKKKAEEALRRSESYLAQAQRIAHLGSWAWEVRGRKALYLSEEWYRVYGFDPKDGMPTWEERLKRVHPEDRARWQALIERAIAEKSGYDVEFRILPPHSGVRYIHSVGRPILDPSGELLQFVGVAMDVTERERAEEERERLRQAQADLVHVNRVSTMGELTASLAHEIKQPIGATVTNAEACLRLLDRDRPDVAEAREAALEMVRDAKRAASIIDRVRSLYRKGTSELEAVDVNEVIGEMALMLHNEANRHSVTIRTELAKSLPRVMADRIQLQQVLMNLMLNGIESMRDTTGDLSIKSQLAEDGQLLISVTDTGVGLPTDNVEHIFNAFFTTKSEGTGLGLAITRSIVGSHGGRVWATANPGRGASFHFTLPGKAALSA